MIANYGYSDGLGEFYVIVDTDRCDGCGDCVEACPEHILEIFLDDYDENVVKVKDSAVKSISYTCSRCKSANANSDYICHEVCPREVLTHSW